jgi:hypothetical protein
MEKNVPEFLDDIPVVVEEVGEIRALEFTGKYSSKQPGDSTGHKNECAAGTFGAVDTKNGLNYILSNNHVLARQNAAAIGEDIGQPGRYDSVPRCNVNYPNIVADLSQFQRIRFSFFANNRIDAAIAQIRSGIAFSCETECGYTPGSTSATATVGMAVKKCGRTTELSTGTVTGVNVTVLVGYGSKRARFTGQIQFTNISSAGDSGSLIVTNNGHNNPVALLFAGSSTTTIGNPINEVLAWSGGTICSTP